MNRGRQAQLWGGPEDGASLYVPPGDLPRRIGAHRTADGALVPIRGAALLHENPGHIQVYEHVTVELLRAWPGYRERIASGTGDVADLPLYVHRDLVTRWLAAP